jgi:hypothetical protein
MEGERGGEGREGKGREGGREGGQGADEVRGFSFGGLGARKLHDDAR